MTNTLATRLCILGRHVRAISPFCTFLAAVFLAMPLVAQTVMTERLAGYVEGCRVAVLTGVTGAFAELQRQKAETEETVEGFTWLDAQVEGLSVSLTRGKSGVVAICTVAYFPPQPAAGELESLSKLRAQIEVHELGQPGAQIVKTESGERIESCAFGRSMNLLLAPVELNNGFSAARVSFSRRLPGCEA